MKMLKSLLICIVCIALLAVPVAAGNSGPTETFTHWTVNGTVKSVPMRPIYEVSDVVSYRSLGLTENIGLIMDIECDDAGNTYILTANSKILCFDGNGTVVKIYTVFDATGAEVTFNDAEGIYVVSADEFYIADTKGARVLHVVNDVVVYEYTLPDTDLIPDDFSYQPSKVALDSKGYLYVASKGSYNGALLYDENGDFVGFYGANTVKGTVLTTLAYFWETLTMNDEKRARIAKTLPYDFSDIFVDDKDFVYTCTGTNRDGNIGQIRRLSPGGTNILVGAESKNFGEVEQSVRLKITLAQNFGAIQSDGKGYMYALDKAYGFVYMYDVDGELIGVFGGGRGYGEQVGTYMTACSMAITGDKLMVADKHTNAVTVYTRTEFGNLLMEAQTLLRAADYEGAKPLWEQVLVLDNTNRMALNGLARAAYAAGDYDLCMEYSKEAANGEVYSMALSKIQNDFITNNFAWIFFGAIVLLAGAAVLIIISLKKQVVLIRQPQISTMVGCLYRPFRSFQDIKYKKMGSIPLALVMTVLFYVTSVMMTTLSDFRYTTFDPATYNSLFELAKTIGLIVLWTVSNWAVCTLSQGNGKLKEVFVVTAYSTLPIILFNLISTPLSHAMGTADSGIITTLNTIALILTGVMLCVGLMTIHDFTFPQMLVTAIITLLFMILVVFVLFMIGILLSQFFGFFSSIILEAISFSK